MLAFVALACSSTSAASSPTIRDRRRKAYLPLRLGSRAISAEKNDRHFRVNVEDRGDDVPLEFVPELFERFTRSTGSPSRPGTGLGLAVARSYAQAHRGDLINESVEPHGARFELVLPVR